MRVCKLQLTNYNGPVCFKLEEAKDIKAVTAEVASLLQEALNGDDPQIMLTVEQVDKAQFDNLPEFPGY